MLNRDEWKQVAHAAALDERLVGAIVLGEPIRKSTRLRVERAAEALKITLPPEMFAAVAASDDSDTGV